MKTALSKQLAEVLPKLDPTPGKCRGDELRVVSGNEVLTYLDALLAKYSMFTADLVRALREKDREDSDVNGVDDLVREWTSGDSAIIVRFRKGRPIVIAFLERLAPHRVRWNFVIGVFDKSRTGYKALQKIGVRECVLSTSHQRFASKLKEFGYKEAEKGTLLMTL